VDQQQVGTRVAQIESRVSVLEDEGKILKGEIKQILTEIRTAVLVRDNPFDTGGAGAAPVTLVASQAPAKVEVVVPAEAPLRTEPAPLAAPPAAREPIPFPTPAGAQSPAAAPGAPLVAGYARPRWSLGTIAGLSAWAEEAIARIGPLRLEILLDLCEAAGHLSPDARKALSRVSDLEIDTPAQQPSQNETAAILRQLEALLDDEEITPARKRR
jgi:hypothetical protein